MEQARKREFLQSLPHDTNEYTYTGLEDLEIAMDREHDRSEASITSSPFIVFHGISSSDLEQFGDKPPGLADYDSSLKILILKMHLMPLEAAASALGILIALKAADMGIRRRIRFLGSSTVEISPGRTKDPHCSYYPKQRPKDPKREWPSVVLETGYSESREKLKSDAVCWLNQMNEYVKLAITIEIKRATGNIIITTWERAAEPTVNHPNSEPRRLQQVKIFRGKGGQQYSCTGDQSIVIPFKKLLLEEPSESEGDIVMMRDDLEEIAENIWWTL